MNMKMSTFNWFQRIVARLSGPRVRDDFEAPTIREHLEFGTIAELAESLFTESALPPDPDQREIARYVLRSTLYPPPR